MNEPKNKLTEEELKLIEEEELFLKEVYSDPEVATAEPPADLQKKVFAQINAIKAAKREAELAEEERKAEEARMKAEAQAIAEKLKECPVKLTAKAGNGGKLFGAVTTKEIADGLKKQHNIDIPKQKLVLDEPIKSFGTYQVKAKLGFEISGTVSVTVAEG